MCNTDSYLTQHIQDITQLNNLSQIVNEYTRITANTQTLIDHIYVNNINHVQEVKSRNRAKRNGNVLMYKKVRNNLVNMVRKAKSQHYHNAIRNSKGNSKVLWKHMRELTGNTCKNVSKL